jgi:hypothetical protein
MFEFKSCINIIKSTGKKARNLHELREHLTTISDESIYHHIYEYFLKGHRLLFTNDFAQWVGDNLEDSVLSERLSNIDPYLFSSIPELRQEIIKTIDIHLEEFPPPRDARPGEEFYFNESVTIIYPVGIRVRNLAEFLIAIQHIDKGCIYYHFYEARTRLGNTMDDFSMWIEYDLNKKVLANKIRAIDPFMHDIEGIREHIIELVEEEVTKDMETV